ncbi:hypothetical protein RvY_01077 [Ramazzottius varieornatus]|uniref:Uncharacterized protein n=1 Tax=Ramazzottius varieornatus TaxID=947166 RepID=A0A1D1UM74_RAMVA|nr:hypothetical protein RvY_01077 [Ramazzottius varieornatus]
MSFKFRPSNVPRGIRIVIALYRDRGGIPFRKYTVNSRWGSESRISASKGGSSLNFLVIGDKSLSFGSSWLKVQKPWPTIINQDTQQVPILQAMLLLLDMWSIQRGPIILEP